MKILHTSDWHLGQMLYSYDRTEEYRHFFTRLKEILRWEMPDAMLVSGDIFDVSNPSAAVARMFKDTILELHTLVPDMKIIVTAGNHDSASRIDIDRNLWRSSGIHVIGGLDRKDGTYNFSDIIIKIADKGYVVALPFVNRASLPKLKNGKGGEEALFGALEEKVNKINTEGLPVVLMAHLAVADCDMQGHRERPIGGFDAVDVEVFGSGFDYVALGHIHKPQCFGNGRIAYSGAPLAVSFDEDFPHTVSIVNVERGESPEIENLEIKPLRALKTIPEEGVPFKKALKTIDKLSDKDLSYIRLNVCQEEDLPVDCMEQAVARSKDKNCRFCTFKFTSVRETPAEPLLSGLKTFEFKEMEPCEVAESYFRSMGISETLTNDYLDLIMQIQEELSQEDDSVKRG
ncbi:MAG: exonuclease subunit SbcD [Muribaculaceae bacterium]|nr:exonuclease subunit SbcD [Muribaculaceae bacterium]